LIESYDVGSLPFVGDFKKFLEGAKKEPNSEPWIYFEQKIVEGFLAKIRAGIDIPNFPQFRDMMEMFLGVMDGIDKAKKGYIVVEPIRVRTNKLEIPEVKAIKRNANRIYEQLNNVLKLKICITGPYTLSTLFSPEVDRTWLIKQLGEALAKIAGENVFRSRKTEVKIVSMDEPVLGLIDDPLLDYGSRAREVLLKAWDKIFSECKSRGAMTCIHLHSTANKIFWELDSLDIVESHVGDPIYSSSEVRKLLEGKDMFLKVSIARTDFDALIKEKIEESYGGKLTIEEKIGEIWKKIKDGKISPAQFLEDEKILISRLKNAFNFFGPERAKFAGPECGLRSFPSFDSAIECLRRVSMAVRAVNVS